MVRKQPQEGQKRRRGGKPRSRTLVFRRRQRVERLLLDGFTDQEVLATILDEFPGTGEGTVGKDIGMWMQRWRALAAPSEERRVAALAQMRDHVQAARADKAYSAVAALERVRRTIEGTLPVGGGSSAPAVAVQVNVANQLPAQDSRPALDLWPDDLFELARPHLDALERLGLMAAARARGEGQPLPSLQPPAPET